MTDTNFQPCLARCPALFHYRVRRNPTGQPSHREAARTFRAFIPVGASHPGVPRSFPVQGRNSENAVKKTRRMKAFAANTAQSSINIFEEDLK